MLHPPVDPPLLALALAVALLAGIARGFSGFGFSAICIAGLALIVSPARVVTAIFLLEIIASLGMLRSVARDVDLQWLKWLVLGTALCLPVGMALLAWLPAQTLRMAFGGLLLTSAALLRSGMAPALAPTGGMRLAAGMVSGLANGVAGIGGLVLVALLSATAMPPAGLRATLVVLILFADVYALAWAGVLSLHSAAAAALLGWDTVRWVLWLAPPMLVGIWIGQRSFGAVSPQRFRQLVLNGMMLISLLVIARALTA